MGRGRVLVQNIQMVQQLALLRSPHQHQHQSNKTKESLVPEQAYQSNSWTDATVMVFWETCLLTVTDLQKTLLQAGCSNWLGRCVFQDVSKASLLEFANILA